MSLDAAKVEAEARFDGKYVLCTDTTLPAAEVAVQYKPLYLVDQLFRAAKSQSITGGCRGTTISV